MILLVLFGEYGFGIKESVRLGWPSYVRTVVIREMTDDGIGEQDRRVWCDIWSGTDVPLHTSDITCLLQGGNPKKWKTTDPPKNLPQTLHHDMVHVSVFIAFHWACTRISWPWNETPWTDHHKIFLRSGEVAEDNFSQNLLTSGFSPLYTAPPQS